MDKNEEKMRGKKKNQHFVPRSFLLGFAIDSEDSLIWGYDKKYSKCTGKRSINQICSFDYYYEQLKSDGSKTQILEDGFQTIETPAIEIIRNLSTSHKLSSDDKGCLAFYIGLLLTRGPSFRDGIHEFHKHAAEIMLQKEYVSGRLPEPPAILKKHIVNNDITSAVKAEILPHVSLQYMFDSANNISQSLCNKKWDVYYIKNSENFVTSDTPLIFQNINSEGNQAIGPEHPQSLILCPITKKMLIAARPYYKSDYSSFEFMPVKDGMVNTINESMCFNAQRFVYASEKTHELLEYIKQAKGMRRRLKSYRFGDAIIPRWDIDVNNTGDSK
ncbi:MAG: DUF4238 domain-containing protein [Planctomycetes bacterium]|nr:DUF4238 domain-containing protein [Planctomycetota bacterium]